MSSTQTVSPDRDKDLSIGMKWSLIVHLALATGIIAKSLIFPGQPTLIVPTLRVDIVGLPDILKKDLSQVTPSKDAALEEALKQAEQDAKTVKPPAPVKSQAEPAQPDEMVLKPKTGSDAQARNKKNKSALDRIKALAKITSEESPKKTSPIIKGNQISKGTSLSGDAKESAVANYYDDLRARLQDNWSLPVWIARKNLSARVLIFIDARGRLQNFQFVSSSGNPQFDDAVKRSLIESQPYPIPPSQLKGTLLAEGILVGFPL